MGILNQQVTIVRIWCDVDGCSEGMEGMVGENEHDVVRIAGEDGWIEDDNLNWYCPHHAKTVLGVER